MKDDFAWFLGEYKKHENGINAKDPMYYWWIPLDRPLLGACKDHPDHSDYCEVYAKVALVNRMYSAQLGRGTLGKFEAEDRVAEALFKSDIDKFIQPLSRVDGLSATVLPEVVECHNRVVAIVRQGTGNDALVFSSKYLSFHLPRVVPILDSRAENTAEVVVKWYPSFRGEERFAKHCRRILALIDLLLKENIKPELKMIDYVLYSGRTT
jgi:hypothetical protein